MILKNSEILFVGANNKMEMNIVPKYGFDILGLWISGFNRTNFIKNISHVYYHILL